MIWTLLATAALAQSTPINPNYNAQLYRPVMDSSETLWSDSAGDILTGGGQFKARAVFNYVRDPLVYYSYRGDRTALVSDAFQADVMALYSINRFRIGVDLPIYLVTAGDIINNQGGLGDLAIDGRITILERASDPIGLAISNRLTLPTASVPASLGSGGLGSEIQIAVDHQTTEDLALTSNLGVRFQPAEERLTNISLNDQFTYRLGGGYSLSPNAGISLDIAGQVNLSDGAEGVGLPLETIVGGWGRVANNYLIRGGVGTGLTKGIGSPVVRMIFMIGYEPPRRLDTDLDGIMDNRDDCPEDPEDIDTFEDDNGCPDPDNDNDGILDGDDKCPLEPEDMDRFNDWDGCADPAVPVQIVVKDPQGNVIESARTTVSGPETSVDGSADFSTELHDGTFAAAAYASGYEPGQKEFTVKTDGDAQVVEVVLEPVMLKGKLTVVVLDEDDKPLDIATWAANGKPAGPLDEGRSTMSLTEGNYEVVVRATNYATRRVNVQVPVDSQVEVVVKMKASKVKVAKERIDIQGTVYFETAKAIVKQESHELLDEVASVLADHPEILKIRIEGHTDSRGNDSYNLDLSKRRAAAVLDYIVAKGISADRLSSEGYGETQPIDPRETAVAWAKNRRVVFFILERSDDDE